MWKVENFLEMMQVNSEIYGEEITLIMGAKEEYLIDYFKKRLKYLLNDAVLVESRLTDVESEKFGDISNIEWKKDFSLTAQECINIGNFMLLGNVVALDRYTNQPFIDYYSSQIIINYIKDNSTPLHFMCYKLVRK